MTQLKLRDGLVIGALHVPALPGTPGSRTPVDELVDFAVENSRLFESAGADALYVQNVGGIGPKRSDVDTVALMSVITRAVVQAVSIPVGVTLAGHDAAGAIAVAFAGGQFRSLEGVRGRNAEGGGCHRRVCGGGPARAGSPGRRESPVHGGHP